MRSAVDCSRLMSSGRCFFVLKEAVFKVAVTDLLVAQMA